MRPILLALSLLYLAATGCTDNLDTTEQSASVRWHYADGTIDGAGALEIDFKLSGLGDTEYTAVSASADASALWVCVNGGGKVPSDPKKQAAQATVEAAADFPVQNGRVVGTLVLMPPLTSPALECPGGQHVTLASVEYSNVTIENPDAGPRAVDGGPFSVTFYDLAKSPSSIPSFDDDAPIESLRFFCITDDSGTYTTCCIANCCFFAHSGTSSCS